MHSRDRNEADPEILSDINDLSVSLDGASGDAERQGRAHEAFDIDPIFGKENLVWAPNRITGQHNIAALRNVVDTLKEVAEYGFRDDMVEALRKLGKVAAGRK